MIIEKICIMCDKVKKIEVSPQAYESWQDGALIQNAMPELSADDREILISSICGPCFDNVTEEPNE